MIVWMLLVGCSRVDADRPRPEVPDAPVAERRTRNAQGCWEEGPCIAAPAEGVFRWDGQGELCVDGSGFGDAPGQLFWSARVRETSLWSDSRVCITARDEEPSALVQIAHADGLRSNREAVVTPPLELTWDVPEPLRTGDRVIGRGRNLGGFGFDNTGETWERVAPAGRSMSLPDVTGASRSYVVHPRLVLPCFASPLEPCTVGALGLDLRSAYEGNPTGYAVTVGGFAAPIVDWRGQQVTVEWPDGLSPGAHTLTLTQPDGTGHSIEVTQLARTRLELGVSSYSLPIFRQILASYADDPILLDGALWFTGERGDAFNDDTRLTAGRVALDDGMWEVTRATVGRQSGLTVPDWGGRPWFASTAALRPLIEEPVGNAIVFREHTDGGVTRALTSDLVAVHVREDELLVAFMEGSVRRPQVERWGLADGAPVLLQDLGTATGVDAVPGHDGPGVWLNDAGMWTGPCNHAGFDDAAVTFTPWTDGDALGYGGPATVFTAVDGDDILACRVTEAGFAFVVGGTEGGEVYAHDGATLRLVASYSAMLPGAAGPFDDSSGRTPIESVHVDGNTVTLLVADRTERPHRLRLARSIDGTTWATSAPFGTRFPDLPGDRCIGPTACEGPSQPGALEMQCVPTSCPIGRNTWEDWSDIQVWRAGMAIDGDEAWVTYQTQRGPLRAYGSTSFRPHGGFVQRVPLP